MTLFSICYSWTLHIHHCIHTHDCHYPDFCTQQIATVLFSVHNELPLSYFLYTTNFHYPVFCHIITTILFSVILLPLSCFLYATNCHYPIFCSQQIATILFSVVLLPLSCFLSYYCQYPVFYIIYKNLPLSCFLYTKNCHYPVFSQCCHFVIAAVFRWLRNPWKTTQI